MVMLNEKCGGNFVGAEWTNLGTGVLPVILGRDQLRYEFYRLGTQVIRIELPKLLKAGA